MAINANSLTDYVDNNRVGLIAQSSLGAKSLNYINVQTGIQGKATLNTLSTNVVFGDGSSCGWNEAGTSTISEREIEVTPLKVNMTFCDKSLYGKAKNYNVRMAATSNALPFEQVFTEDVAKKVAEKLDVMIWEGDGTGNSFEGFATILNSQKVALSGTTVRNDIDTVYMDIPAEILDKAMIFTSIEIYRAYVKELSDANLYHYAPKEDGSFEVVIPGTSTKLVGIKGVGAKHIFAADPENLYFGCDMASDSETFDFWYSKDNQEFRLAVGLSGGTQVAFPTQVIFGERA